MNGTAQSGDGDHSTLKFTYLLNSVLSASEHRKISLGKKLDTKIVKHLQKQIYVLISGVLFSFFIGSNFQILLQRNIAC